MSTDYVINLYYNNEFPNWPLKNVMENRISFGIKDQQLKKFQSLKVTWKESI